VACRGTVHAWNEEIRALYQRLIRLRRGSKALSEGGFQVLDTDATGSHTSETRSLS